MALKDMSPKVDTVIGTTGGTAITFVDNGSTIANGVGLIVPTDDYNSRRSLVAKVRNPTLNPKTGMYGKDKKSVVFVHPMTLTDGSVVFNTLRIEREVHPSFDSTLAYNLNEVGAQILFGGGATDFWAYGSLT